MDMKNITEETIDLVAKELLDDFYKRSGADVKKGYSWESASKAVKNNYRNMARIAIEAMPDPSTAAK